MIFLVVSNQTTWVLMRFEELTATQGTGITPGILLFGAAFAALRRSKLNSVTTFRVQCDLNLITQGLSVITLLEICMLTNMSTGEHDIVNTRRTI